MAKPNEKPKTPRPRARPKAQRATGARSLNRNVTRQQAEAAVRVLLRFIGEDVEREGLVETPRRYVKALEEMTEAPDFRATSFDGDGIDEMVIQDNIPFYSLCEHHLLPFHGEATIAYVPNGRIIGLSKLARCLDKHARRLQNQERLTQGVADSLHTALRNPKGVAVVTRARHMCMEARGIKKAGSYTTTSALRGVFMDKAEARSELLNLIKLPSQ